MSKKIQNETTGVEQDVIEITENNDEKYVNLLTDFDKLKKENGDLKLKFETDFNKLKKENEDLKLNLLNIENNTKNNKTDNFKKPLNTTYIKGDNIKLSKMNPSIIYKLGAHVGYDLNGEPMFYVYNLWDNEIIYVTQNEIE